MRPTQPVVIRKGSPRYWNEPRTIFEKRAGSGNWPWWIEHISHERIGAGKGAGRGVRPVIAYRAEPYAPLSRVRRHLNYLRSLAGGPINHQSRLWHSPHGNFSFAGRAATRSGGLSSHPTDPAVLLMRCKRISGV